MTSCFYSDPQRQSRTTKTKIKEEFKELRRYLKTEEANLLAALKREESQKIHLIQMIKETSSDALSLSDGVKKMEELATDASFLTSFKSSLERTQKALLHPEPPQVQIEEAKYVENLQFRVLRKLLRITRNISGEPAASPRPQVAEVQPEVMLTVTCRYPGSSQSPPPQRLGGEDNVPKHHRRSRRLVQRDDPTARCTTCTCTVQHVHVVSPPE
ncbi:uncharacterized protein LOC130533099 isoform X2 [Takifugu flavidus]|nr:uncharacterized protein LOC130533099 isoform X2 [Takifugu flavidus]